MNEPDQELFANGLKRLRPAHPPPDFMARLESLCAARVRTCPSRGDATSPAVVWSGLLRWLLPASLAAALALVAVVWLLSGSEGGGNGEPAPATTAVVRPDDVEIDRQWVAAYDALAQLPGGEPVRVRCQEWRDRMILRDSASGVEIERDAPRLEIISVSLDTY